MSWAEISFFFFFFFFLINAEVNQHFWKNKMPEVDTESYWFSFQIMYECAKLYETKLAIYFNTFWAALSWHQISYF